MKKITQKEFWEMIMDYHKIWSKPNYYLHVTDVAELIERDNDIKVPLEMRQKLERRYKKWRDANSKTPVFRKLK